MKGQIYQTKELKNPVIYTPEEVSNYLYGLLAPRILCGKVLDPCCGSGRLLDPWFPEYDTVGYDIQFGQDWFETDCSLPNLILCNPPFCSGRKMMMAEQFLRNFIERGWFYVPIVMFVPMGFRFNVRKNSRRRVWMKDHGPQISSIISVPLDLFPDVQFFSEILIFNVPNLNPHYWIDL